MDTVKMHFECAVAYLAELTWIDDTIGQDSLIRQAADEANAALARLARLVHRRAGGPMNERVRVISYPNGLSLEVLARLVTAACWATRRNMEFELGFNHTTTHTEVFFDFDVGLKHESEETTDLVHFKLRWGA